jgi:outer membrane protein assembly factor BamB
MLLGLPIGFLVTGLVADAILSLGDLSGPEPGWFSVLELFGALPALPLLPVAVKNDGRTALAGLLAGAVLCGGAMFLLGGEDAPTVWSAAHDRPGSAQAVGSWHDGDLVVRVQPDRLTAYRVEDGTVAWRWTPPGRDVVCEMSRTVDAHTGLVGQTGEDGTCEQVTAVALDSGRPRWTEQVVPQDDPAFEAQNRPDVIAVGQGLAVLPTRSGWQAVDLVDGRERWSTTTAAPCVPLLAYDETAGPVVTVADCGPSRAPVLRTYAAATGRGGLRLQLPARGVPDELMVLSADPLTVWVREEGVRGTHGVLSYDGKGVLRATIPLQSADFTLNATPSAGISAYPTFAARPARTAIVTGDVLVASAVRSGDRHASDGGHGGNPVRYDGRLVAFSLTDGHEMWRTGTRSWVQALTVQDGHVWVLSSDQLGEIDPGTGEMAHDILLRSAAPDTSADLWVTDSGRTYVVVNEDGTAGLPPVAAARRR